jgi:hypothetical protein
MTVSSQTSKETFNGNGVTNVWDLPFRFFDNTDIFAYRLDPVTQTATLLVLGTDYTLSGAGLPEQFGTAPGKITTAVPIASGKQLFVERIMDVEQLTDIVNQGRFFPEVHEDVFDRLTMLIQQNSADISKTLRVQPYDPDPTRIPSAAQRANQLLSFDSFGNPIVVAPASGSATALALSLANKTDPAKGAGQIGYRGRWVSQKLDDFLTVEDFGAVGDGITNDTAAILAMHAYTGGTIRLLDKPYFVGSLILSAPVINVLGARKPTANSGMTALESGSGSILIGRVFLRSTIGNGEKFGVDNGSSHGLPVTDGFVFDSLVGQSGKFLRLNAVASMGKGQANVTHAVLTEGWDACDIRDIDVYEHTYGLVAKNRNGIIDGVRGRNIRIATCYVKSDIMGGGQADVPATVVNMQVSNVQGVNISSNDTTSAVYIHASTDRVSNVQVNNATQTYGHAALRVYGADPSTPTVDVTASNITGIGTKFGLDDFGWTFETMVSNLRADNPTTGQCWTTTANSINWTVNNATLVITDAALNALTVAAVCLGQGAYSQITVRNSFLTMSIAGALTTISHGVRNGQVVVFGEGNLTLNNGASPFAGAVVPAITLCPDNDISLTGQIDVQALTAATMVTLTGSMSFGPQKFFPCTAQKTDNSYVTVNVFASGVNLLLLGYPIAGLKMVDISSVRVKRN